MFISVLQLGGHQNIWLQILHVANSSWWIIIFILISSQKAPKVVLAISSSWLSYCHVRHEYNNSLSLLLEVQLRGEGSISDNNCAAVRSTAQRPHLFFSQDLLLSTGLALGLCLSCVTGMLCVVSHCLDSGWLGNLYLFWTCFISRAGVADTSPSVTSVTLPAPHWCSHLGVVDLCCP